MSNVHVAALLSAGRTLPKQNPQKAEPTLKRFHLLDK